MTRIKLALGPRFKYFWFPLSIAIWTILQSMAHAWWVVYGRGMIACEVQVKRKFEFYLYMTYLYSNECDNQALDSYAKVDFPHVEDVNITKMFHISRMFKPDGTMTESLMDIYLGSDAVWTVASVGLLIGILMRLKQGSALVFYLPWIFIAITILAMDLFCSLYFALQLPTAQIIQTSLPWKLEKSTIMAIISGRLGFIWILNVANMVYIMWYTRVSYQQRYADERRRRKPKMRRQETENRIKNWQLFYGEIDDNATNTQQKSTFMDEADLDYSTTFKELEDYNHKRKTFDGSAPEQELCSTFKSSSSINPERNITLTSTTQLSTAQLGNSNDMQSATCIQNIKDFKDKKKVQITELVSHLPWSYIDSNKKLPSPLSVTAESRSKDEDFDEKDLKSKQIVVFETAKNLTICNPVNEQVSRF